MEKIGIERPGRHPAIGPASGTPDASFPSPRFRRCLHAGGMAVLAAAALAACAPVHTKPVEVEAKPPRVSYNYSSDNDLIEADAKARVYCSQYASTPSMRGSITTNPDGTKMVTFECIKGTAAAPPPSSLPPAYPPPMSYPYTTDTGLLEAMHSAEAYCARTGQIPSSNIVTNPDGTKTLTFRCVAQ